MVQWFKCVAFTGGVVVSMYVLYAIFQLCSYWFGPAGGAISAVVGVSVVVGSAWFWAERHSET